MSKLIYAMMISALFFLASCAEEPISQTAEKRKVTTVAFDIQKPKEVLTRAFYDDRIFNITILTFDKKGILFSKKTAFNNTGVTTSLQVPGVLIEDGCRIYAVANIGHNTATNVNYFGNFFQGIVEESDMLRIMRISNIYTDMPVNVTGTSTANYNYALAMVGKTEVSDITPITPVSGTITIPMQRVMAQLSGTISVEQAAIDAGVRLIGARIGNMADASYLFPKTDISGNPVDVPLSAESYSITDWFAPQTNASLILPSYLYLFENHKGEGMDKSDISSGYSPPACATYLEILLDKNGVRYYYKVYLGANNTTSYDIERNNKYAITININSVTNIESDIRVTRLAEEDFWYITDGLLLHYDGIDNNGRAPRVTNDTEDWILDPPRPGYKGGEYVNTTFYYDYSVVAAGTYGGTKSGSITGQYYSVGSYVPILTSSPDGMKNRWKNIAPATLGRFNLPIYSNDSKSITPPNCWGPDCLVLKGNTTGSSFANMEYDETNAPELFPELFTVECVFLSSPSNTSTTGNDLFGFFLAPGDPYVIADVEVFQGGFGLIAGSAHNNMNYGTSDMVNKKRRLVLQFDGQKMIAWYENKMVYTEPKRVSGALPWTKGKMGSPGPNFPIVELRDDFATQFSLGTWSRHQLKDIFNGNIYAFRFYNRVLSQEELDNNYALDVKRFGMSK